MALYDLYKVFVVVSLANYASKPLKLLGKDFDAAVARADAFNGALSMVSNALKLFGGVMILGGMKSAVTEAANFQDVMFQVGQITGATGEKLDSIAKSFRRAAEGARFLSEIEVGKVGTEVSKILNYTPDQLTDTIGIWAKFAAFNKALFGRAEGGEEVVSQNIQAAALIAKDAAVTSAELPKFLEHMAAISKTLPRGLEDLQRQGAFSIPVLRARGLNYDQLMRWIDFMAVGATISGAERGVAGPFSGKSFEDIQNNVLKALMPIYRGKNPPIVSAIAQALHMKLPTGPPTLESFFKFLQDAHKQALLLAEKRGYKGPSAEAAADRLLTAVLGDRSATLLAVITNPKLMDKIQKQISTIEKQRRPIEKTITAFGKTYRGASIETLSRLTDLGIQFGEVMLPFLTQLFHVLTPIIEYATHWMEAHPELTRGIAWATFFTAIGMIFSAILSFAGILKRTTGLFFGLRFIPKFLITPWTLKTGEIAERIVPQLVAGPVTRFLGSLFTYIASMITGPLIIPIIVAGITTIIAAIVEGFKMHEADKQAKAAFDSLSENIKMSEKRLRDRTENLENMLKITTDPKTRRHLENQIKLNKRVDDRLKHISMSIEPPTDHLKKSLHETAHAAEEVWSAFKKIVGILMPVGKPLPYGYSPAGNYTNQSGSVQSSRFPAYLFMHHTKALPGG